MDSPCMPKSKVKKQSLTFATFCGDQRLEQELINMMHMKVYIYCKTLSSSMRIEKSAFQKPETDDALSYCSRRSQKNY